MPKTTPRPLPVCDRDLDDLRALSSALGEDLAARANSGGQIVEIMHAHAHSIVHRSAHSPAGVAVPTLHAAAAGEAAPSRA